jgi:hypothetical protein
MQNVKFIRNDGWTYKVFLKRLSPLNGEISYIDEGFLKHFGGNLECGDIEEITEAEAALL